MSERMADERWNALVSEEEWMTDEVGQVIEEAIRARTSEAEKNKEIERLRADKAALVDLTDEALQSLAEWDVAAANALDERFNQLRPGAALLEELSKKDATIKALADALELSGYAPGDCWHTYHCHGAIAEDCTEDCVAARAALRLCGRLP